MAYRFFATPRRKFIIADTPGHIQYAQHGHRRIDRGAGDHPDRRAAQVLTQSKRHGFIASLLQIPHVVVAVNKMDLVGYQQAVFDAIRAEYTEFASKLSVPDIIFIPISALQGDNVVNRGGNMPWYGGATLLNHLEHVSVGSSRNLVDFRFPVQMAVRPHAGFRGFAGQVASGTIRPGEEVAALPSGRTARCAASSRSTASCPRPRPATRSS